MIFKKKVICSTAYSNKPCRKLCRTHSAYTLATVDLGSDLGNSNHVRLLEVSIITLVHTELIPTHCCLSP